MCARGPFGRLDGMHRPQRSPAAPPASRGSAVRRRSRLLGLALAAIAAPAFTAPSAHAEFPLVGVLTGGELRSSGSGTIRTDQVASDFTRDPASPDNCIGEMCNDHRDLNHHQAAAISWDTTWLVDARYPGAPVDPNASANAIKWKANLGSWTVRRLEEDFQFPDDQGEGGHEQNPVSERIDCDAQLVARMPEGAETPLLSTAGAGEEGNGFFDASKGRSMFLNAFGSTFSTGECGPTDRYGYWGLFGFAPVEGEEIAWDLGTEPREEFRWERKGRLKKTEACSDEWTDDTPRDTNSPCADTTDLTSENVLSCALCVTDVRYDEHPGGKSGWQEVGQRGTYDGNEIRITTRIENRSTKTLTVPLLFKDKRSGRVLEGPGLVNPKTYTFPAGGTTDLEVVWKTDGFAWEGGKPASERDIQILTPYGGAQQRIVVNPRPVVLVHGWKSSAAGWDGYDALLRQIHPLWRGYAVGDGQANGTMDTSPFTGNDIADNATAEHLYVQGIREKLNADHVDVVAHSMGGLISRKYIHERMTNAVDGRPIVRRLVMLGTPNMGSPCADLIRVAARGIPTQQLTTGYAKWFNTQILNRKGVPFSIAAGDVGERTCTSDVHGDGVVEVPSAHWTLGDRITTFVLHTSMTESSHLLSSFVKPRLALDPTAAKGLASQARRAATAERAARGDDAAGASGDAAPVASRASAAADPWAGATASRSAAGAQAAQAVGTADAKVNGKKLIRASFGAGAMPGFAFLAEPTITAELVDPKGKVVATQAAGSDGAKALVRWLSAPKGSAGTWTLRLTGTGSVVSTAVATGGKASVGATLKVSKKGAWTITAKLKGVGTANAKQAKVTATVQGAGGKPAKLTLKRKGSTFSGTLKKVPAGATTAVVTAKAGKTQLLAAADLR